MRTTIRLFLCLAALVVVGTAAAVTATGQFRASLTATTHALERLPGVQSVQLSLNREMIMATDYVHGVIREEISKHGKFVPE